MDVPRISEIFRECDSDADGHITREELRVGFRRLGIPLSAAAIEQFMQVVDPDHDGKVTYREFVAAVLTQQERLMRAFKEIDHGTGDNRLTTRDIERFAAKLGYTLSHDEVATLVSHLDRDKDGSVELAEFCEYFLTHVGDMHAEGIFESWLKSSAISSIPIPDTPEEDAPTWVLLTSGATAGIVSRTLTAPADRIKTLLQASSLPRSGGASAGTDTPSQGGSQRAEAAPRPTTSRPAFYRVAPSPLHTVADYMHDASRYAAPRAHSQSKNAGGHTYRFGAGAVQSMAASQPANFAQSTGAVYHDYNMHARSAPIRGSGAFGGGGVLSALASASRRVSGTAMRTVPAFAAGSMTYPLPDLEHVPPPPKRQAYDPHPLQVRSIRHGIRTIYSDGGLGAFWRGNGVNVMKVAPETAARFWMYETLKGVICEDPDNITLWERFTAGAGAGAFAQAMIYPLEVAKTRFTLSAKGEYSSLAHCLSSTVHKEGPRALYRGLLASLIGIIPYSGVDLTVFSLLKEAYERRFPDREPGVLTLLLCGAMSTTVGQIVSYPLQLVRTRLQAQGMPGRPLVYSGILDCFIKTIEAEGARGLYRGIAPNFMKSVPAMAISYATYELTKRGLMLWRRDAF